MILLIYAILSGQYQGRSDLKQVADIHNQ